VSGPIFGRIVEAVRERLVRLKQEVIDKAAEEAPAVITGKLTRKEGGKCGLAH